MEKIYTLVAKVKFANTNYYDTNNNYEIKFISRDDAGTYSTGYPSWYRFGTRCTKITFTTAKDAKDYFDEIVNFLKTEYIMKEVRVVSIDCDEEDWFTTVEVIYKEEE